MAVKSVAIDNEIYEFILEQAKRNHRTVKGQIAYMVEMVRVDMDTDDTQVSMPETDAEREALMERIR